MEAVQVHCPFCNSPQARNATGTYECEFCLQPFSVVEAEKEESRLLDEIKRWLADKVGVAALDATNVDAASRAYIFQEKILPPLRRDVDRSLEAFGSWAQFPLVAPPVGVPAPKATGENPLIRFRSDILALKSLRARLGSPQVTAFLMTDGDKSKVQALDRRVSDYLHLSNVVDAASRQTPDGYASARKNLEVVLGEISQSLALEAVGRPDMAAFLTALQGRYRGLIQLCQVCEELSGNQVVEGDEFAARLDGMADESDGVARAIEGMDYSPADTIPMVIATDQEAHYCRHLARWMRGYGALTRRREMPFTEFARTMTALLGSKTPPETAVDLMEGCAQVVRIYRGEIPTSTVEDFDWADAWVEARRQRKTFGLFGVEEAIEGVVKHMLPVWVAEVRYAQSTGGIFKEGQELRCLAALDACTPEAAHVAFVMEADSALAQAMAQPSPLQLRTLVLPTCTATFGLKVIEQAAKANPALGNPKVTMKGLAFVPAIVATYTSKKGDRQLATALQGALAISPTPQQQLATAQKVFGLFA